MNRTNLRWKIYKLLRKYNLIDPRRGGYSLTQLFDWITKVFDLDYSFLSLTYPAWIVIREDINYLVQKRLNS